MTRSFNPDIDKIQFGHVEVAHLLLKWFELFKDKEYIPPTYKDL